MKNKNRLKKWRFAASQRLYLFLVDSIGLENRGRFIVPFRGNWKVCKAHFGGFPGAGEKREIWPNS